MKLNSLSALLTYALFVNKVSNWARVLVWPTGLAYWFGLLVWPTGLAIVYLLTLFLGTTVKAGTKKVFTCV